MTFPASLRGQIDIFRTFQALRRQFKRPCDDERDGKSGHDCEHNEAHGPIWNFEKWKNLRGNLNQKPADDRVRDRDFVNIAPLEFGEKRVPLAHGVVPPGGV